MTDAARRKPVFRPIATQTPLLVIQRGGFGEVAQYVDVDCLAPRSAKIESTGLTVGPQRAKNERISSTLKVDVVDKPLPAARRKVSRKRPGMSREDQLDLCVELYRISGVDLTRIDGISLQTAHGPLGDRTLPPPYHCAISRC
jgi:hypothetical protein